MAENAVLCIAKSEQQADKIVTDLRGAGFADSDISVLLPDKKGTRDFAHEKGTKMPEGAATGAATGGVLGGTLGLLAGIGALAIPGVGPLIAAGPIMLSRQMGRQAKRPGCEEAMPTPRSPRTVGCRVRRTGRAARA